METNRALLEDLRKKGEAVGLSRKIMDIIHESNMDSDGEGDQSMTEFCKKAREVGIDGKWLKNLEETDEDRLRRNRRLREMGLPRYRYIESDLNEFRKKSGNLLETIAWRSGKYIPKILLKDGTRPHLMGCGVGEILPFIEEKIKEGVPRKSKLLITEFFPNWFGFTVVSQYNENMLHELYAECCIGKHYGVAHGKGEIVLSYSTNPFTGSRQFARGSKLLTAAEYHLLEASLIYTVDCILPRIAAESNLARFGRNTIPVLGAYEGTFTKINDSPASVLDPFFFDYDSNKYRTQIGA